MKLKIFLDERLMMRTDVRMYDETCVLLYSDTKTQPRDKESKSDNSKLPFVSYSAVCLCIG